VDFGWVMQTTFVLTVTVGALITASVAQITGVALPTWGARANFALRVGAVIWLFTATGVYLWARREATRATRSSDSGTQAE
jgi:hypothetical protein